MSVALPWLLVMLLSLSSVALAWWVLRLNRRLAMATQDGGGPSRVQMPIHGIEAIAAERERIYNDLHDDLGARLLQLIYEAQTPRQADLARAVLQDLRDVVTRSRGTVGNLEEVLSDIRTEATQRLSTIGTTLRWEQPDELPDQPMPPERALHLYRIVREAISNALRHADARRLRVRIRCSGERLDLELTDDGHAGPPTTQPAGRGMRTMRERADQLHGEIAWLPGTEGGTKVLLSVPLAGG